MRARHAQVSSVLPGPPTTTEAALLDDNVRFSTSDCEWLRHCVDAYEMVGSSCSIVRHSLTLRGFCYTSEAGSLECGRAVAARATRGAWRPVRPVRPVRARRTH